MSIFSFIDSEERSHLDEYIELTEKQAQSTTGSISVGEDGVRTLADIHAAFLTNGVSEEDTIELFATTPQSIVPARCSFYILEVVDENTIKINGEVEPLGANVSYRVISTGLLQAKLNSLHKQQATIINVDIAEALFQEGISKPWYNKVTEIVTGFPVSPGSLRGYFGEYGALTGALHAYPVTETDIAQATASPPVAITAPGPLLYPFYYQSSNPDRRIGDASTGLGTPALQGFADSIAGAVGERPNIVAEEAFYAGTAVEASPPPYYIPPEADDLLAIKAAITAALNTQIDSINALIPLLDAELFDLQTRGVTGSAYYSAIAVARLRLNTAWTQATFHLNDGTVGVSTIDVNTDPVGHPRRAYITGQRLTEIDARAPQILEDQDPWISARYSFLARRVNRNDGSLTLVNRSNNRLSDIQNKIDVLTQERTDIKNELDGNRNG